MEGYILIITAITLIIIGDTADRENLKFIGWGILIMGILLIFKV